MNILVTGAAGYVGSTLTPLLASHGHRVVAIDCDEERLRCLELALVRDGWVQLVAWTRDEPGE